MMYTKDKKNITPFEYTGKRLVTGFGVVNNGRHVKEVSMFSRGV